MSALPRLPALVLGLLSVVFSSCSIGVLKPEVCASDDVCRGAFGPNFTCAEGGYCTLANCASSGQCREALGIGWACGADTLCAPSVVHPRCSSTPTTILTDPARHQDDLIIGSIFDRTDFLLMVRAARLAVLQVNDRDGLGGRDVGIIDCTNEEDPALDELTPEEAVVEVGRYMVEQFGVSAIVGPATSGLAEVAFNALSPLGAMLISPSATSPALSVIDGLPPHTDASPGTFWRTAPPDSLQGRVIAAQMIDELGATRVAVVHETGAYGEGLAEVFLENFNGTGREATAYPFASNTDLATITATVGASDVQQVLVISSRTGDVSAFLNAAAGISGYATKGFFLTDGARDTQLLTETAGPTAALYPRIRGTVPAILQGLVYDAFSAAYRINYDGEDPADFGFSAHAWDAAWLVLAGAAWAEAQDAGVVTGLGIARGLRKVSSGADVDLGPTDWTTVRASFAAGQSVNVSGASGALDFDPDTEETTAPIFVWVINEAGTGFLDIDCIDLSAGPSLCPDLPGDDDDSAGDDDDSVGDDDDSAGDDDDSGDDDSAR